MLTAHRLHVRYACDLDIPAISEMELHAYGDFAFDVDELRRMRSRYGFLVVSQCDGVRDMPVGYLVYQARRDALHVRRMGVFPSWRRRGAGLALLRELRRVMGSKRLLTASVGERNVAAQMMLRSAGWRCVQPKGAVLGFERGRG